MKVGLWGTQVQGLGGGSGACRGRGSGRRRNGCLGEEDSIRFGQERRYETYKCHDEGGIGGGVSSEISNGV